MLIFPSINQLKESKSTGSFTATLPPDIPAIPKEFVAGHVMLSWSDKVTLHAAEKESDPVNTIFTFVMPSGLTTGTYDIGVSLDPNVVLAGMMWSPSFEGPGYFYAGFNGFIYVNYLKEEGRLQGRFVFDTIGSKKFEGKFDIIR